MKHTETQNKKTLVIPDVHQRIYNVDKALRLENFDEVVFLGDWLDSFLEPPDVYSFEDTCNYLKSLILEHPRKDCFKFLVGNHDMNYIFNNVGSSHKSHSKRLEYYCSGYSGNKCKAFKKTFWDAGLRDTFFIQNFSLAHRTQGWLMSHAGLVPEKLPYGRTIDDVLNNILPDVWRNFRNTAYCHSYLMADVGTYRGGNNPVGGILWLDWNIEMFPHQSIGNQIVGHTRMLAPAKLETDDGKVTCWNLDTELHYGIVENEKLYTRRYIDL